ncbi:hypothetical protein KUTeg_000382 [Tegillarca granosa]|uniref:Uncharacterized protein n=1 Tax=Tegillarca granosa TaxID=220873 RepID=A0ABQ9G0H4_TEGGR|nr:hypothetical protein KUTeg_000382 [Tegillarca granosa]
MKLLDENMNISEKTTLQNCRNCFLEDLDPTMTFLSSLYCAGILTEDQRDRIDKQTTRQDKVDYHWISERLENELHVQECKYHNTKKIEAAIDERMKKNGEFIRDKDYILRTITESVVPILLQEKKSSPVGSPNQNASLKGTNGSKLKLDSIHTDVLLEKMVEIIDALKEKCCKTLGIIDLENMDCADSSLSELIEKNMQEMKTIKKLEEKLTTENTKLKTDNTNLKAEVKRLKLDGQCSKTEAKKLKEEIQKIKTQNQKLKLEIQNLKEHLNNAGIDLRISADFIEVIS